MGWFVFLATALLLFGFGYYIYQRAESKGWFKIKAPFFTYVQSSTGLNEGDPVYLMGRQVGQITHIVTMPPRDLHNVKVEFEIQEPSFRHLWTGGSVARLDAGDFLGKRQLEVTRGTNGYALVVTQPVTEFTNLDELASKVSSQPGEWQLSQEVWDENSNIVFHAYETLTVSNLQAITAYKPVSIYAYNNKVNRNRIVASWDGRVHRYKIFQPGDEEGYLRMQEAPSLSDQVQGMVSQVQNALPGILALTNKLAAVLDNAADVTSNLNTTILAAQPMVTNFAFISAELRDPGSPLVWALGTNGNGQVQGVLTNLNNLLVNTDTNLGALLSNLAELTGGLNAQVQANSNMLGGIAKTVGDADDFVQGLKRHWLLRSAFKTPATNKPPTKKK